MSDTFFFKKGRKRQQRGWQCRQSALATVIVFEVLAKCYPWCPSHLNDGIGLAINADAFGLKGEIKKIWGVKQLQTFGYRMIASLECLGFSVKTSDSILPLACFNRVGESKPTIATHAQNFAAVCRASIEKTPSLVDFVAGKNIPVSTILITNKPREGRSKLGYLGIHDVLNANNYDVCLRRTGDKVEVVGCITEIKLNKASNGKPYISVSYTHLTLPTIYSV